MAKKQYLQTFLKKLKQQDWTVHFIELLIVILGIFIAFQFSKIGDSAKEKAQFQKILANIKLENEQNLEEFGELKNYRKQTVDFSLALLNQISQPETASEDSIRFYIFKLFRISTPDLQIQALDNLINTTLSYDNQQLKDEAIQLKVLYDEWLLSSERFVKEKSTKFFSFLYDSADFYKREILDYELIYSLRFKNNLLEIYFSEREQSKLYKKAFVQLELFNELILRELED